MKTLWKNFTMITLAITISYFAFGTARVQVIHNAADANTEFVDVYLNKSLLIDDFQFRTATPFINAPSGSSFEISVAPANSMSVEDAIWTQKYQLAANETYILVANGLLPSSTSDDSQTFDIFVYGMGQESSNTIGNTDLLVFHGSNGAPTVDVAEIGVGVGQVIDDLTYGEFSGYLSVPTNDYIFQILDQNSDAGLINYSAPLATLGLQKSALVVVASGFFSPEGNQPAFGLWAALSTGGDLVALPVFEPGNARVQIIHNSADMAAETVDVWVNGGMFVDDFMFRTSTPFVDVPTGININVAIQGPNSTSAENPIWSNDYVLEDGKTYIMVANGIVSPDGYTPATPFDIWVYDMGREEAMMVDYTDLLVFHGSTDAPTVDIVEIGVGAGTIVNDLTYGDFDGYLELPTDDYILSITDATGENTVISYAAPLSTLNLDGAALVAVASGFLNPDNNSNGEGFGIWAALPSGGDLVALPVFEPGNARVQVIHNSADLAAETVDVWANGNMLIDDFMFRTATPFIDVPAGVNINIAIQGPNSTSAENPIWSNNYVLEDGKSYVLVANGIVSGTGYNPATPFDIWVYDMGREEAMMTSNTDVLVFHGSTDAPTVDVVETGVGAGTIVNDLMYGDFDGYLELPTNDYILSITDETGENTVISYAAPLATLNLDGAALITVASGFLNPAENSDGEAFGLWVALPSGGEMISLPVHAENKSVKQTARVQVIHNSADAAAEVVDVWLNDVLLLDNFTFRTASPFVDAPAGEEFTISIKGPDSMNSNDPIWSMNYTLAENETYILIAEGIVSPSGYTPATPFDIAVYPMGREMANMMDKTDVLVHHGSTDAPTVDVYETGVGAGEIVNDLMYAGFAGYLELGTMDYVLEIRDETGESAVAAYQAPLATLGLEGAALTVVASGFLNTANNSDGPAFGLWVALANGGNLVELPMYDPMETARVQVIHNSADAAAEVVDVWLNDVLLLDNFTFRTASPFVDAPAGEEFTISIKGPDSMNSNDPIWSMNYTLESGETYILVADGIVSPSGYNPSTPFDIAVYPMGREMANMMDKTDVLVHHGSTDAPTVDVYETGVGAGEIVNDLMYAGFAGYLELATMDYVLEIRDETGESAVAAYDAPLASLGLEGAALTVVASGFLTPENNSNGPGFGLYVALPAGGELIPLPSSTTGFEEKIIAEEEVNVYPNPVSNYINIQYSLLSESEVTIQMIDMLGNTVREAQVGPQSNQLYNHKFNVNDIDSGLYFVTINAGSSQIVRKVQVVN
jgi:hypothetical protein